MIYQFHFWVHPKRIKSSFLERYLYTRVHSSIIHSSQNVEASQVFTDREVDKQNVVHVFTMEYYSTLSRKDILTYDTI